MFYIRDCNDQIVGNLAGYRTMRGAQAQHNNPRSSAARAIRQAFELRELWYERSCMPLPLRRRNLSSVRLMGEY